MEKNEERWRRKEKNGELRTMQKDVEKDEEERRRVQKDAEEKRRTRKNGVRFL